MGNCELYPAPRRSTSGIDRADRHPWLSSPPVVVTDRTRSSRPPELRVDRRIAVLVGLALLLIAGPMMHGISAAPAPRYLLTVAILEDGTIYLDHYAQLLFSDQALVDGRVLSDKAPYQSLASVPLLGIYRMAGGDTLPVRTGDDPGRADPRAGVWWLTLWTSLLPAFVLFLLMHRMVVRVYEEVAVRTAVALLFGTILLPFAAVLFGHVLSATLVFAAWFLTRDTDRSRDLLWAGVMIALGVGTEYPVAICAAVLFGATVVRQRWQVSWMALGGFLGAVPLMIYHTAAFGGPFRTAYQGHLPYFQGDGALGVYNLQPPDLHEVMRALVGERGFFVLTPVLLVALLGAAAAIINRTMVRRDAVVAMVMLVGLLVISTGVDGIGGASPGPRYLIPVIPFMALPLAEAWRRFTIAATVAALIGGMFMVVSTITNPLLLGSGPDVPRTWLDRTIGGEFASNLARELGAGVLLPALTAAGVIAIAAALHLDRRRRAQGLPAASADLPVPGAA